MDSYVTNRGYRLEKGAPVRAASLARLRRLARGVQVLAGAGVFRDGLWPPGGCAVPVV